MQKLEAQFISKTLKKIIQEEFNTSFLWECKFVRGDKYYFSQDKSLKKELINLKIKRFVYKFSDLGMLGTPVDGVRIQKTTNYFFIKFKNNKCFCINSDTLECYIEEGNKYLTAEICETLAFKTF